jgi:hypothetical protein
MWLRVKGISHAVEFEPATLEELMIIGLLDPEGLHLGR